MSSVNETATKSTTSDITSITTTKISLSSYSGSSRTTIALDMSSINVTSITTTKISLSSYSSSSRTTIALDMSSINFTSITTTKISLSSYSSSRKTTIALDMSSINESSPKSTTSGVMSQPKGKTRHESLVRSSPTRQMPSSESDSNRKTIVLDTSSIKEFSTKPSRPTSSDFWSKTKRKTSQETLVRSSPTEQLSRSDHDYRKTFALDTGSIKESSTKPSHPTTSDVRSKTNRKTSPKTLPRSSSTVEMPSINVDSNETTIALWIVLPIVLILLLILIVWLLCRRKRNYR